MDNEIVDFETRRVSAERFAVAPDGSDVRPLTEVTPGGMAHFELAPGATSVAVGHRTVAELWYFISGRGADVATRQHQIENC